MLVAAGCVAVLVAPGVVGLADQAPLAQVVALRGLVALGLLAAAAGTAFVALVALPALRRGWAPSGAASGRRSVAERAALGVVAVLLLGAAADAGVLVSRGTDADAGTARAAGAGTSGAAGGAVGAPDGLTVLAFNTFRSRDADALAALVLAHDPDLVVLPETSGTTAAAVARLLAEAGRPTQALARPADTRTARGTALLVAERLGPYRIADGLDGRRGTFLAVPVDPGSGAPPVVAAHTVAPSSGGAMPTWRREVAEVADACRATPDVVVAGDLNATLDHPALGHLAPCLDAAAQAGSAAVGTWPEALPPLLGAPIDHVLADGRAWRVTGFAVLPGAVGSDHRPVLAHLARR